MDVREDFKDGSVFRPDGERERFLGNRIQQIEIDALMDVPRFDELFFNFRFPEFAKIIVRQARERRAQADPASSR